MLHILAPFEEYFLSYDCTSTSSLLIALTNLKTFFQVSPANAPVDLNSSYISQYLINEADLCQRHTNLSFIVYIHSSLEQVEKRQQTRVTWASAGMYDPNVRMAVVFMVGHAKTEYEEVILKEESEQYNDIVQVCFIVLL